MDYRRHIIMLSLITLALAVRAQGHDDGRKHIEADSVKNDFEEWLRNEPLREVSHDSTLLRPLPPSMPIVHPRELQPKPPSVSINIMTPNMKTDAALAYQSHWLEEQRKAQQGGAVTIGVSPLAVIGYVLHKLFPKRKSKKQRERERLQQILDNY